MLVADLLAIQIIKSNQTTTMKLSRLNNSPNLTPCS